MPIRPIEVSTFANIPSFVPFGVEYFTQDTADLYVGTGASTGPAVVAVNGGGGGTPGGSNGDIQYNNNSVFGGSAATLDAAGNLSCKSLVAAATVNAATGYQVNATATTAQYLRGDGTNFVPAPIQSGDVTWDKIGNAGAVLTLANGTNTTEFDQTNNAVWKWYNTTAATPGTTNASPVIDLSANYWTGAVSSEDKWTIGSSLTAGTNGTSTLSIDHSGSSGTETVNIVPGGLNLGVANSVAGSLVLNSASTANTITLSNNGDLVIVNSAGAVSIDGPSGLILTGNGGAKLSLSSSTASITTGTSAGVSTFTIGGNLNATSSQSQSVLVQLYGRYWTGSSSGVDTWSIETLASNGTNAPSTLVLSHTGTPGFVSVQLPDSGAAPTSAGTAGTAGQIAYTGGVLYFCSVSGAAGSATWNKLNMTAV